MSRVNDFDDVYSDSRYRLLLQLYAYAGDVPAAEDALDEAFISASRHWHRLSTARNRDGWLRDRAIKQLDGRPRIARSPQINDPGPARPAPDNVRLLSALAALDATSRRLLIVRRLDDVDLAAAAREVGLTNGAAEQALARVTSALHGRGVDTTPAGLGTALLGLGVDLQDRPSPPAQAIRRAGAQRRFVFTMSLGLVLVATAAGAGSLSAANPLSGGPAITSPTTVTSPTTPPAPPPRLTAGSLLTGRQVTATAGGAAWRGLPPPTMSSAESVYGGCTRAADNPPPFTRWIRDFSSPAGPKASQLREVLQLAPSQAEATRAYQQIVDGFTVCADQQLVSYSDVASLGERARLVGLRLPSTDGPITEYVVVAQSGPSVTFLSVTSTPAQPAGLTAAQLVTLAGTSVDTVCDQTRSACARPPYPTTAVRLPGDGVPGGFLSAFDLPIVDGLSNPWAATDPARVTSNPSATACDQADFAPGGASAVRSRRYVIRDEPGLPRGFGMSETVGTFASGADAKAFVSRVSSHVARCHTRQDSLRVAASSAFTAARSNGNVWKVLQSLSKTKTLTLRTALVRYGDRVAQVTFTPTKGNDVSQPEFVALAHRAAVRLAG